MERWSSGGGCDRKDGQMRRDDGSPSERGHLVEVLASGASS